MGQTGQLGAIARSWLKFIRYLAALSYHEIKLLLVSDGPGLGVDVDTSILAELTVAECVLTY